MSGYNQLPSTSMLQEKTIPDKITAIKNLVVSYEMRLRGGVYNPNNNSWVIKEKALIGENFIRKSTGIINSYSENANLFTTKEIDKFNLEFADAFFKVNAMLLNDPTTKRDNYKSVIKMFKDTLGNIGDIIIGSKDSLKSIFEKYEEQNTSEEDF